MHDSLTKHAAQLARLAMMIRIGLESVEAAIPSINDASGWVVSFCDETTNFPPAASFLGGLIFGCACW
ncbi:MAG: hypothetical protein WED27_04640 [Pirellulales bacterium]